MNTQDNMLAIVDRDKNCWKFLYRDYELSVVMEGALKDAYVPGENIFALTAFVHCDVRVFDKSGDDITETVFADYKNQMLGVYGFTDFLNRMNAFKKFVDETKESRA